MATAGFSGPLSVFEGRHGLLASFAPSVEPDFDVLTAGLGERWEAERVAFKPYACGTMAQPFIDCAIRLGRRMPAEQVVELCCSVGEGTVHRLWEPLALKQRPPNGYAAKFSTPYCVAIGFLRGAAGLAEFSEECVGDPAVLSLAARVTYRVDPEDEYPRNYTGRIRATLTDGRILEEHQPHLRGGRHDPLTREELLAKCKANLAYGGTDPARVESLAAFADELADRRAPLPIAKLLAAR
jgi:2-methylcitrate dehydratase PrpD